MAKTRTRTTAGKFVGDDPATPENEAWTEKKKPGRKKKASLEIPPPGSAKHKSMVLSGLIKE
tara:strand:+ start:228 stop:413 length:186 start_codon:yes stop_codon:yes gene_type:complete